MRLKEFLSYLEQRNISSAVLSSIISTDPNIFYLGGLDNPGALLFLNKTPNKTPKLFWSCLEPISRPLKARGISIRPYNRFKELESLMKKELMTVKRLGINSRSITVQELKWLRILWRTAARSKRKRALPVADVSGELYRLRSVKTIEEIERIKRACSISSDIIESCLSNFNRFKTEEDAARFLRRESENMKCGVAFEPIVASGANSAIPHYKGRSRLRRGFCVIDFGVKHRGYCSDISRTIYLGRPGKKEREAYNALLSEQESLIRLARPGIRFSSLESELRKALPQYRKMFLHTLGHSLGIEIHEPLPKLLSNNVVFTIEPGIYNCSRKKFGIRIEDTVAIINGKCRQLTSSGKALRFFG